MGGVPGVERQAYQQSEPAIPEHAIPSERPPCALLGPSWEHLGSPGSLVGHLGPLWSLSGTILGPLDLWSSLGPKSSIVNTFLRYKKGHVFWGIPCRKHRKNEHLELHKAESTKNTHMFLRVPNGKPCKMRTNTPPTPSRAPHPPPDPLTRPEAKRKPCVRAITEKIFPE